MPTKFIYNKQTKTIMEKNKNAYKYDESNILEHETIFEPK